MPLTAGRHLLAPSIECHVFDAPEPGPTALVQAGIHGDEVAGVHALTALLDEGIRPIRGRLIVIPVMNPPAYAERSRTRTHGKDLNRCFPGDPNGPTPEDRLAHCFMQLVLDERPSAVMTLHESKTRYDPNVKPSFGQTLVYGVKPCPAPLERVVERLNAHSMQEEQERWSTLYYPVATSSTEVVVDAIGCLGTCVETWMGFPEARRTQMHKDVVHELLAEIGVLSPHHERTC